MSKRQRQHLRFTRDGILFILGAGGFLHELLFTNGERPTLLIACFALMGVPIFLRNDEHKRGDEE